MCTQSQIGARRDAAGTVADTGAWAREATTRALEGIARCDHWRSAMTEAFGPFEVHPGSGRFGGSLRYTRRAGLQFTDLHYAGQSIERTRGNVSSLTEEFYTFGRPISGPLRVERPGETFVVEPGCLYLMNQSLPYRAHAEDRGFRSVSISIPSSALLLRSRHLRPFYRIDLNGGAPAGTMLDSYFKHIFENLGAWSETDLSGISERFLDLLVMFLDGARDAPLCADDSSVTLAHRQRILSYIRLHLADPELSPERIAQGCGISLRYFYKIMRAAGMSAESHIIERRLDKCRELLVSPLQRHLGIAELCFRCGFRHQAHFSRLFKQRFGDTPRAYRARHLRAATTPD